MTNLSQLTVDDCDAHNKSIIARAATMTVDELKTAMIEANKTWRENHLDAMSFDYFYSVLSSRINDDELKQFMDKFSDCVETMLTVETNIETFRCRDDDDIRDPIDGRVRRDELGRQRLATPCALSKSRRKINEHHEH